MFALLRYLKGLKASLSRLKDYQTRFTLVIVFLLVYNLNWFDTAFKEVFIYSRTGRWCPRCSPKAFIDRDLINLTDQYIINKPHLCEDSMPLAFIMVTSSVGSKSRRDQIRATWMKEATAAGMKVLFSLGSLAIHGDSKEISMENEMHQDIVQLSFVDDWRNLTLKTIASLSWFKNYCSHAKYYIKVDDDAVINVANLVTNLATYTNSNAIIGHLLKSNVPCFVWWKQRHCMPSDQHFKLDYLDRYPPYPAGPMYVITQAAVMLLVDHVKVTSQKDLYFLEDVYITLLAREIGIDVIDDPQFLFCSQLNERNFEEKIANAIVIYDCSAKQLNTIWSLIQRD
ncbi:beta-1,3-galactosyltransferase 5-like [Tetranychus urticae]|uniref:beta-1,3-galactosyltransferase 5-like n=1 Tax=Tetranychus urticae TaxID=32264 RepID=UPI00077BB7C0|nr:beta-1,3-galactosyltransferase 5-like [Tetranychus urticae]